MQGPYSETSYKIVSIKHFSEDKGFKELQKKVNDLIKEGYTPLGGISISIDRNGYCIVAQAMELRR